MKRAFLFLSAAGLLLSCTWTLGAQTASAALHEDNRYFASGEKGIWPRVLYAVTSTVLAHRHDSAIGHFRYRSDGVV